MIAYLRNSILAVLSIVAPWFLAVGLIYAYVTFKVPFPAWYWKLGYELFVISLFFICWGIERFHPWSFSLSTLAETFIGVIASIVITLQLNPLLTQQAGTEAETVWFLFLLLALLLLIQHLVTKWFQWYKNPRWIRKIPGITLTGLLVLIYGVMIIDNTAAIRNGLGTLPYGANLNQYSTELARTIRHDSLDFVLENL